MSTRQSGSSFRRDVATFTPSARHLQIEYGDVDLVCQRHGQGFRPGGRLGHDQQIVLQGQQRGERARVEMLVVGEQEPYGSSHLATSPMAALSLTPAASLTPAGSHTATASLMSTVVVNGTSATARKSSSSR
ncbi:hypothetical protein SALBM311S_01026 [Streptomyces alboniger]